MVPILGKLLFGLFKGYTDGGQSRSMDFHEIDRQTGASLRQSYDAPRVASVTRPIVLVAVGPSFPVLLTLQVKDFIIFKHADACYVHHIISTLSLTSNQNLSKHSIES